MISADIKPRSSDDEKVNDVLWPAKMRLSATTNLQAQLSSVTINEAKVAQRWLHATPSSPDSIGNS